MLDLLILGAGPAGLGLAHAATRLGLDVQVLDPAPATPWPATYACWLDELGEHKDCTARRWASVEVHAPSLRVLERPYALLDNERLQARLSEGVEVHQARAISSDGTRVETDRGAIEARVVVDATGHAGTLVKSPAPPLGWQTAYGVLLEVERHPFDRAVLMDLRGPNVRSPTFLYVLPHGPNRVFLEETSLVSSRAPLFETLRDRLDVRLERMGLSGRVLEVERCLFPMGTPLPSLDQPVVGFGAAAGMGHPATGYSVGRVLNAAERVARAVREGAPATWRAVWPAGAQRARSLQLYGAGIVEKLDLEQTRSFFDAFFALPVPAWKAYLDAECGTRALASSMLRFFAKADGQTRGRLVTGALT